MSDTSERMDISPSRLAQVSTCEKLRDTVTGISALHMSLQEMDGRSASPRSSFKEMYLSSTQTMIRKKEVLVRELETLPPCTGLDCQDHKIPSTSVDEEINFETSHPDNENKIKINSKPNKKKLSKIRKNKAKESTEVFIFPKKTARPISPTSTQDTIETNNPYSDLEQDVEHPLSTDKQVITEVVTPKRTLPHPIMLKINDNFREQIKRISEKFPSLRNRITNDVVKMFTNDHEEYRSLIHFLESDKEFEFYIIILADHLSRYVNNITIALPESKDLIEMQRNDPVLIDIQKINSTDAGLQRQFAPRDEPPTRFRSHRYTITRPSSFVEQLHLYNTEDCDSTDSTLHLAFALLDEPPTRFRPHRFTITRPSYCMEQLRLYNAEYCYATLHQPQESSPRLRRSRYRFPFFPFKTWTVVYDQEFASARRKDDGTVGTAETGISKECGCVPSSLLHSLAYRVVFLRGLFTCQHHSTRPPPSSSHSDKYRFTMF
ncbi:hypothetical protein TNCV_497911 [Trichonephila clavipes]|nr:hypothetical protein TNCV_497911 [Trichonephila clavipes]